LAWLRAAAGPARAADSAAWEEWADSVVAASAVAASAAAAYSQVMDIKGPLMAKREFRKPMSRVDQSLKDFHLMLEQARGAGQELPFAAVYARLLEDCMKNGEGEWDNAAIAEAIARQRLS
jgi:3-hydroxyisobutyrate dehydrogenase-like beta-hydroxyacid dehydrogenase